MESLGGSLMTHFKQLRSSGLPSSHSILGVTLLKNTTVDIGSPLTVARVENDHSALISINGYGWSYACFVQRNSGGIASTPFVLNGNLPTEITVAWSNANDYFVLQSTSNYGLSYAVLIL